VTSLLCKTEFGVPRTVGGVNHPQNEWQFNEVWGVDVSVSTPRLMSALVEEAVTDPRRAFANLLAGEAMFTARLRRDCARLRLPALEVHVGDTVEVLLGRVAAVLFRGAART
jgi:Trk K+ transport system NAD-binding subunit